MENYIEVIKRATELLETIIDGLNHIQKRLNEGYFEDTIFLFEDAVQAFSTIEGSLKIVPSKLSSNDLEQFINNVRNAIEIVVSLYEEKNYAKVKAVLQFTLIPSFNRWKRELQDNYKAYLVS